MIDSERRLALKLKTIPSIDSKLGVFVAQSGSLATVNIGPSTVQIPYVGQYPAQVGDTVQIERRNGQLVVTGPANPKSAAGRITAITTPKLTVEIDTVSYMLPYDPDAYPSPAINDDVSIDWFYPKGRISGRLSTTPVVVPPPTAPPSGVATGRQTFTALWSKSYRPGPISGDDVIYGSSYPSSGWGYGSKIKDSIPDAAVIDTFRIYLVCTSSSGSNLQLGQHSQASQPASSFAVTSLVTLPEVGAGFSGWVDLLSHGATWADFLKANDGGIGTTGAGFKVLKGLSGDGQSGALDIGWH